MHPKWFAYYCLLDVTTILELAIWRVNMDGNEQDAEARQERRRMSGSDMNIIIPGVVSYLEDGREEDGGGDDDMSSDWSSSSSG